MHAHTRTRAYNSSLHTRTCSQVWFLQFSHNGKLLASGCKDGEVIVWDITVR